MGKAGRQGIPQTRLPANVVIVGGRCDVHVPRGVKIAPLKSVFEEECSQKCLALHQHPDVVSLCPAATTGPFYLHLTDNSSSLFTTKNILDAGQFAMQTPSY